MTPQDGNWSDCLNYGVISDVGMRRANNQDSYAVVLAGDLGAWRERGHFFMVADGMGAHAAGELASKLAVDAVPHHYHKYRNLSAPEALEKAITEANAEIHRRGQANPDFRNMGTTASCLALLPQGALAAHVGDSRIYRLRDNHLEQLTFDHSWVWELRASGQLKEGAELSSAIPKNVITRSLGPCATVQVDLEGPHPVEVGDTFLLCSDGLTGQVEDTELCVILSHLEPEEAAQVLADLANLRGGPDNITVIVAKVTASALTTAEAGAEPLQMGRPDQAPSVHPATWVVLAASLLAAVGMLVAIQPLLAALAAAVALASLVFALYQKYGDRSKGVELSGSRRLGRGPYTKDVCSANQQFVHRLAEIVRELREAAAEEDWNVQRAPFERDCQQAAQSAQANRHSDALRQYARAISFMMRELRNQYKKKASDSAIDY